jgi:hypothetical protein
MRGAIHRAHVDGRLERIATVRSSPAVRVGSEPRGSDNLWTRRLASGVSPGKNPGQLLRSPLDCFE